MAALAYVLPPLSGLVAFLRSGRTRIRFHGLQSVAFGFAWPACLYGGALIGPGATQTVFVTGGLLWLFFLIASALGRDPRLPVLGRLMQRAADEGAFVRDGRRSTSGT